MSAGGAWYDSDKKSFIDAPSKQIVDHLTGEATKLRWHIESEQLEEWEKSVDLLKTNLNEKAKQQLQALRAALSHPELDEVHDVILEYDFRRRGLRLDCILLAPGALIVVEFKRTKLSQADRDQVMNYCINLAEFHEHTQELMKDKMIVIPVLALTEGKAVQKMEHTEFYSEPWNQILKKPLECDTSSLHIAISNALKLTQSKTKIDRDKWLKSKFAPSSTILDAAISLYGQHDVSAIKKHSGPVAKIERCTASIKEEILKADDEKRNCVIFLSGAPGAGKTLVGLNLAFDTDIREDALFVTGNAPLVDVLSKALEYSYKGKTSRRSMKIPTGYAHENVQLLVKNSTFKIVKAHHFLKDRGQKTTSKDGRVLVFDEAQRTYVKGKRVAGHALEEHEAELILNSMEDSYSKGAVVVALIGHNQAINSGERGIIAWFEAAEKKGWSYSISDETLQLPGLFESQEIVQKWKNSPLRRNLSEGHLSHSIRYYRNQGIEEWAHQVMDGTAEKANSIASKLHDSDKILITRNLNEARNWIRERRIGDERVGMIASSAGRRLIAEGIYVQPQSESNIAQWMLAPSGDVRSSNMLEVAVTQFQIQGLEVDYTLVCWDADLRQENGEWASHQVRGAGWSKSKAMLEFRKNTYRVLLTRARKGMVIFVPKGDDSGEDETRDVEFYDGIYNHLIACGATDMNQLK